MFPSFASSPLNPPRNKLIFNVINYKPPVAPVVKVDLKVPPNSNAIHYFLTK